MFSKRTYLNCSCFIRVSHQRILPYWFSGASAVSHCWSIRDGEHWLSYVVDDIYTFKKSRPSRYHNTIFKFSKESSFKIRINKCSIVPRKLSLSINNSLIHHIIQDHYSKKQTRDVAASLLPLPAPPISHPTTVSPQPGHLLITSNIGFVDILQPVA